MKVLREFDSLGANNNECTFRVIDQGHQYRLEVIDTKGRVADSLHWDRTDYMLGLIQDCCDSIEARKYA